MNLKHTHILAILTTVIMLTPAVARAEGTPGNWTVSSGILGGTNPTVVGLRAGVEYTRPLYPEREGILWESARIESGLEMLVNPSFANFGGRLYVEPIAIADITVRAGIRHFTNALGLGLAPLSGYGDESPAASGASYNGQDATGWYLSVAPRLKAAAGPIILTATLAATYLDLSAADAGYLAEPFSVSAVAAQDWVMEQTTNLLYQLPIPSLPFLAFGLEYYLAWVPAAGGEQDPRQRVSALGLATIGLSERLSLEGAAFVGLYPTGVPIRRESPYMLTLIELVYEL